LDLFCPISRMITCSAIAPYLTRSNPMNGTASSRLEPETLDHLVGALATIGVAGNEGDGQDHWYAVPLNVEVAGGVS
jgi:hypothetical protein